jgi:alpha-D-ribose 1-methylphosphonate 5-triphosphate diphosphatase
VPFGERTPVGLAAGAPGPGPLLAALRDPVAMSEGARALFRVDVRCPSGLADLEAALADTTSDVPPLVSHEDHTPGIGQYADPATMEHSLVERAGMTPVAARAHVNSWRALREGRSDVASAALRRLGDWAQAGRIRLAGHDPQTRADVESLVARGGAVAEFPTTLEAARAAREHGLSVVAGGPNVVRGSSHTANVSARELVAHGLVDALASDYVPSSLLMAVEVLVREGLCDLPGAVRLVTSGPARAAGLHDRGALAPGARADVVLVRRSGRWPSVAAVLRAAG